MRHHLSFRRVGKAAGGPTPRSEPDSGNPTVRDRRGACGNAEQGLMAICHEIGNDGYTGSHYPKLARAVFLSRLIWSSSSRRFDPVLVKIYAMIG